MGVVVGEVTVVVVCVVVGSVVVWVVVVGVVLVVVVGVVLAEDLHCDAAAAHSIAAYDDEVGIEGLGDADGSRSRGTEVHGEAEVVESKLSIIAGYGEESYGGQALIEGIGKRVADPAEVGLPGAIVERQDKDNAASGLRSLRSWC